MVNAAGIAITYAYDAIGQRATMAEPTGTFTYAYDRGNRISKLTNPEGQVTSWSYDAASRVTRQVLANGVAVSNIYDNADRQFVHRKSRLRRHNALELRLHVQFSWESSAR